MSATLWNKMKKKPESSQPECEDGAEVVRWKAAHLKTKRLIMVMVMMVMVMVMKVQMHW